MRDDGTNWDQLNRHDSAYHVRSLARGLQILTLFSDKESWLGQTEIMRRTGFNAATTLRLVRTLELLGFLEQSPETKKYRPGLAVLKLGHAAIGGIGLRDAANLHLQRLSTKLGETVNLGVLVGNQVVYIERVEREQILTPGIHVGSALPAYSTSIGKALLATLDRNQLDQILDETDLIATGPNTITDRDQLLKQLERIRIQGYAIQDEELVSGLRSIAMPVHDYYGEPVAAINVAVRTQRVSRELLLTAIHPELAKTAADVSASLGARVNGSPLAAVQRGDGSET